MSRRSRLFPAALLFLLVSGTPAWSEPTLNSAVAPTEVVEQVGEIVRREFYDPRGLEAFDAAEARAKRRASGGDLAGAVEDWLATLDASHTGRFTPETIDYFELSEVFHRGIENRRELYPPEGVVTYSGIGMVAQEIEGQFFASDVYDGSPAAKAGVKLGDEILSVDGEPYRPVESFAGKIGRSASVEIRREREAAPFTISVPVERLQPRDVFLQAIRESGRIIESNGRRIAYLRLWAFAVRGVEDVIADLLTTAPLKDADGLVLDLRGRWGGAPADATELFVGRAPHMTVTDRDGDTHIANMRWKKPVVAIVDEGSRSGMEILAYGLKSAGVPLVGARTAGAVLAGRAFRLKDNSLLEVAVLDVHVDGERLEGLGVSPQMEVPFDIRYANGRDPQLDRAVAEMEALLGD